MRRALRKSIPFVWALLIGTMAGAVVAGVAIYAAHSSLPDWIARVALARLAPGGGRNEALERAVVQLHRIALALHGQPQHAARELVRLDGRVADRLEGQPRFIEGGLQDDKRLGIE